MSQILNIIYYSQLLINVVSLPLQLLTFLAPGPSVTIPSGHFVHFFSRCLLLSYKDTLHETKFPISRQSSGWQLGVKLKWYEHNPSATPQKPPSDIHHMRNTSAMVAPRYMFGWDYLRFGSYLYSSYRRLHCIKWHYETSRYIYVQLYKSIYLVG